MTPQAQSASPAADAALVAVRNRFVDTIPARLVRFETFKQMLQSGEQDPVQVLAAIADLAHKITGVAETLGFSEIGRLANAVDRRISKGSNTPATCARLWQEVAAPLEQLLDEMESHLDT